MTDDEVPSGGVELDEDPPWDAWHPLDVAGRLAGVDVPWYVAGGWALDLFRGTVSRDHEDLEIAVPAGKFGLVRAALADFDFEVVGSGRSWPLDDPAFDVMYQTWVRERAGGVYRLDVFREPHEDEVWICRRDENIRLPYSQIIATTPQGVPYLVPEIALLFKAKRSQPKDQADFAGVLPLLSQAQRDWLVWALERVHPGHSWTTELSRAPADPTTEATS